MRLNVTASEYLNDLLAPHLPGTTVPFTEAMLTGNACAEIFSPAFCEIRSKSMGILLDMYMEKIQPFISVTEKLAKEDKVFLYFCEDTLCQMNLLTVLAYLEEKSFAGSLQLEIPDAVTGDMLMPAKSIRLGKYKEYFTDVFVKHALPACDDDVMQHAINRYFELSDPLGDMARLIRHNASLPDSMLISMVMSEGKEDGIDDAQARALVKQFI